MSQFPPRLLVIGTVWPEPKSSAAGIHLLSLINAIQQQGYDCHFACPANSYEAQHTIDLSSLQISAHEIQLNDSSFDEMVAHLAPDIVLFDRFMMEEQFSWRVRQACPNALCILDTEDVHSLRDVGRRLINQYPDIDLSISALIQYHQGCVEYPQLQGCLHNDLALREITSMLRMDLSLIISRFEMKLLKETFKIQESLLCHLPFFLTPISEKRQVNWPSYEDRRHFVFIGNFLHAPNLDAALMLKRELWKRIRPQIPDPQLHIYGAYPNQQVRELHNVKEHFYVHGFTESATDMLEHARVLLAPLRFGAGLKGKLTDAMQCGTPSVTTNIGAEGMCDGISWSGFIADDWEEFARSAVLLYSQKKVWLQAQQNGTDIINNLFVAEKGHTKLLLRIEESIGNLSKLRSFNFIGQLLHYHTAKSTKYLSKWIEEKKGGSPKN